MEMTCSEEENEEDTCATPLKFTEDSEMTESVSGSQALISQKVTSLNKLFWQTASFLVNSIGLIATLLISAVIKIA